MDESVMALAGFHEDIAAASTVAAGGAAARDELLPTKSHAAIAAIACLHPNSRFINKHSIFQKQRQKPFSASASGNQQDLLKPFLPRKEPRRRSAPCYRDH